MASGKSPREDDLLDTEGPQNGATLNVSSTKYNFESQ
jgi:hypothetical protein